MLQITDKNGNSNGSGGLIITTSDGKLKQLNSGSSNGYFPQGW